MKLISMTDFVLEYYSDETRDELQILDLFNNYANFLKQPLELFMFVSCNDKGNVLEEPTNLQELRSGWADNPIDDNFYKVQSYRKAKERCLFKGFKLIRNEDNFFIIEKEDISLNLRILKSNTKTNIEILLKWREIKLTPTAIKQIGL